MLSVENVSVTFDGEIVLNDISFMIKENEILGVLGPSGSGKSTLLKVIAGLIIPDVGIVRVNDVDISRTPTHLRNIGMVFQDNQLFPHMNVAKNIAYGLHPKKFTNTNRDLRVSEMLELVGLTGFEKRSVGELSGGEAKRIALARSLAPKPSILLLDEPLTGLDKELHDQLMVDLRDLLRQTKTTAVLVTHDKSEAQALADRVMKLKNSTK